MARKVRRSKPKSKLTWKKLLAYFTPVIVVAFLVFNQANSGNVLGEKDSRFFGLGEKIKPSISPKPSPRPTCNRVTSFSASAICQSSTEEKSNNAFSTYAYTCEDGTTGSVEQKEGKCVPISKAYELARKACHQKCKPTKTPSPIPTEITSE